MAMCTLPLTMPCPDPFPSLPASLGLLGRLKAQPLPEDKEEKGPREKELLSLSPQGIISI